MNHTPGPWKAEPGPSKQWRVVPHYDGYDRRSVATTIPVAGEPHIDPEANARLIASAPELLAALEELVAAQVCGPCSLCDKAHAAIDAARTEA